MTMKWVLRMALMLTCAVGVAAEGRKVEMLMTGDWHGEEVRARNGEQWLALTSGKLAPVKIQVESVHDGIIDMPGEKSGRRVTANGAEEYTVLLKGLTPREIEKANRVDLLAASSGSGAKAQFVLSRDALTIETRRLASAMSESEEPVFEIVVSGGGLSQVLGKTTVEEINVIWSGDLDADGKLDLVVDTSDHYNIFAPSLFLSTEAGRGQIVGEAASFVTSGC
jgi:hypothetical protein